jgi:multiple sugar transport system ATP-binding protein
VAGFIGSPAMNFLPATVQSGVLRTALGDLPLGERMQRVLAAADAPRELVMGLRPEHFEDAALVEDRQRSHGYEFTAPVDLVESMGSDKYVYFTIEGAAATSADLADLAADAGGADLPAQDQASLVTRLSAESRVRDGVQAKVWMNLDKIHLFDPKDGRNMTLPEGRNMTLPEGRNMTLPEGRAAGVAGE